MKILLDTTRYPNVVLTIMAGHCLTPSSRLARNVAPKLKIYPEGGRQPDSRGSKRIINDETTLYKEEAWTTKKGQALKHLRRG